jgi:glycoside/pentoside/hexuronide:cation symporter, GPH family
VFMGGEHGLTTRAAYVPFGWTCGAIIFVATLTSATSALELRGRLHDTSTAPRASSNVLAELRDVFRNPSFVVLFLTVVVFWVAQGTAGSLQVHVFRYFWKLSPATIQGVLVTGTVGLVLGIPLCGSLLTRMEKRDVAALGLALFCIGQFVTPTLAVAGWMPSGPALPIILGAFALAVGAVITCVGISFGSMMIDAADEHELRFGVRREALYFAGLVFAGKCAIGAGALFAGVALDAIGFPSNLGENPDQLIGADVVRNLGLIYGPGASLISVVSVAILLRYRLDRGALTRVQEQLQARRALR